MPDLLREGSAWLERMRTAHCSGPVEYRRDGDTLTVNATFGKTDIEVNDESGLTVASQVWDFLILADDLGLDPEPGDAIVTDGRKFEVMGLGGESCWRFSDPYRQTLRIHTKEIGADL